MTSSGMDEDAPGSMEESTNSDTQENPGDDTPARSAGSSENGDEHPSTRGGSRIQPDVNTNRSESLTEAADSMFADSDPIFADKNLLQISHVPQTNRIVGREEEIARVGRALADATRGNEPENILIHGRTGTGKSLAVKYVTQLTKVKAQEKSAGPSIGAAYIDCKTAKTETKFAQMLGSVLNDPSKTDVEFPDHGLGYDTYIQRIWTVLDVMYDVAIVILDEIDKHKHGDSVLSTLSRAGEDEHITECNIGLVIISNRSQWVKRLEQRTGSGLQAETMVFSAYDEQQLTEIMDCRRDAFQDGVLTDDVIPLVAEYAAQEHGDARRALDILRNAGKLCRDEDDSCVTTEHVHNAADYAEKGEVQDHISDEPPQSRLSLLALALLCQETDEVAFTNDQIHRVYTGLAEKSSFDPLSQRRVIAILDELTFFEIIYTKKDSGGYPRGSVALRTLVYSPNIVESVVCESRPEFTESRDHVRNAIFDYLVEE